MTLIFDALATMTEEEGSARPCEWVDRSPVAPNRGQGRRRARAREADAIRKGFRYGEKTCTLTNDLDLGLVSLFAAPGATGVG